MNIINILLLSACILGSYAWGKVDGYKEAMSSIAYLATSPSFLKSCEDEEEQEEEE